MRGGNCLASLNSKMKMISARNKMKGEVINVNKGAVNGIVKVKFGSNTVSATISLEAIKELGITEGKEVTAIAKATDVMVGVGEIKEISARNIFKGEVVKINEGAVNSIVNIKVEDTLFSATISKEAAEELKLAEGKEASVIIKATSVMIMA